MPDIDEEARALGRQEGKMSIVLKTLEGHSKQMDRIEGKVTTLRIKMGGASVTISLITTITVLVLRFYVFK